MTTANDVLAEQAHRIASHYSLAKLLEWGRKFTDEETAAGRRVIWAPCHALGRSLSLRSWVIQKASEMLGSSAPSDAPTLLSGATDTLVIADPASADRESLNWLCELLACAEEVRGLTASPPLPRLVVLLPVKNNVGDVVNDFTNRLFELGSEDEKLGGREADLTALEIDGTLRGLPYAGKDTYEVTADGVGEAVLPSLTFTQAHRVRTKVTVAPAVGASTSRRQVSLFFECFAEVVRATSKADESELDFATAAELRRIGF